MTLVRRVLILAALALACSPAAPTATPSSGVPPTATPVPAQTADPTPTALPNGLANRPLLPALVGGEVNSCLPLCASGLAQAGPFEDGVPYQTKWFFGGYMTITPGRQWSGGEDSTGELSMMPPGDDYGVHFALDLYPVTDQVRVTTVPSTADGLVGWLRGHDDYDISDEIPATIGSLPATAIDVWNAPGAPSQYPDCVGEPCSDMFSFEQYHDNGGILGDDIDRIYFADVEYGGTRHVLTALVEGRDRAHLDSLIPAVEELLATVTVPAHAAGAPGRIAFARYVIALDDDQIYVIDADGSDERRLLDGAHECPRWSPRTRRIAMTGDMAPLFVDELGDVIREAQSPDGKLWLGCGAFSPDGAHFAAEGWDDADIARSGIYVLDVELPDTLVRLTTAPPGATDIPGSYSPDGKWLAFNRNGSLFVIRSDGSDLREIARGSYGVPAWAPDGRSLLADALGELYRIEVDLLGTGERTRPQRLTSDSPDFGGQKHAPIWSPDGRWIAFSMVNPGPYSDLWVMRLDGTRLTRVTDHPKTDNIAGEWVP